MKILILFGCVITLASLITAVQEFEEDLKRIGMTNNNGDHQRETKHKQIQQHNTEKIKTDYTGQPAQSSNGTSTQDKRNGTRMKKQRVGINRNNKTEDQREMLWPSKHQNIRKKKKKTSKLFQSPNVFNTTRNLKKRSVDYEDTLDTVHRSQDISSNWNTQEEFIHQHDSHEYNTISSSQYKDLNSNIMNENSDHTDSSESSQPSSSESSHPKDSSSDSVGSNESNISNNSNESNSNSGSRESLHADSNELNTPTVIDPLDSFEPGVQKHIFNAPTDDSESTKELSESSDQSLISNNSSESSDLSDSNDSNNLVDSKSSSDSSEATLNLGNITESISYDDEFTFEVMLTDNMGEGET